MLRTPLVAGNWKLHGSLSQNAALVRDVLAGLSVGGPEVAVCVPYPYLAQVSALVEGRSLRLGAQDVSRYAAGAYTGEVSAAMLHEFACRYVLVGHSERRSLFGESDDVVAEKAVAAQLAGLVPVVCVGETLAERQAGETEVVVGRQLAAVLAREVLARGEIVVAYEPVWAIGTGMTATPAQAQTVHAFIRARLAAVDPLAAEKTRIVYGGSVKPENAAALLAETDIDGGLIGGASLVAKDFLAICQAARR